MEEADLEILLAHSVNKQNELQYSDDIERKVGDGFDNDDDDDKNTKKKKTGKSGESRPRKPSKLKRLGRFGSSLGSSLVKMGSGFVGSMMGVDTSALSKMNTAMNVGQGLGVGMPNIPGMENVDLSGLQEAAAATKEVAGTVSDVAGIVQDAADVMETVENVVGGGDEDDGEREGRKGDGNGNWSDVAKGARELENASKNVSKWAGRVEGASNFMSNFTGGKDDN